MPIPVSKASFNVFHHLWASSLAFFGSVVVPLDQFSAKMTGSVNSLADCMLAIASVSVESGLGQVLLLSQFVLARMKKIKLTVVSKQPDK